MQAHGAASNPGLLLVFSAEPSPSCGSGYWMVPGPDAVLPLEPAELPEEEFELDPALPEPEPEPDPHLTFPPVFGQNPKLLEPLHLNPLLN